MSYRLETAPCILFKPHHQNSKLFRQGIFYGKIVKYGYIIIGLVFYNQSPVNDRVASRKVPGCVPSYPAGQLTEF